MNKHWLLIICLGLSIPGWALKKLDERYLISYGNPQASTQVVEYFSFTCPHCLSLFQKEFHELKTRHLDTGAIAFTMHPVPMDLLTVRAMDCLEKLDEGQKRAFLEVMMEAIQGEDIDSATKLMQKAMQVLGQPVPHLDKRDYLESSQAFEKAFLFLRQESKVSALPTAEINGTLYSNEVPSLVFLESKLKESPCGR